MRSVGDNKAARQRRAGLLLAGLLLAGCARNQGDSRTEDKTDEEASVVLSKVEPPYPVPWQLSEDLTIGVLDGFDEYVLRSPQFLAVFEDGAILVLDNQPLQFRLYDAEGRFVRAFGRPGNGPTDIALRGTNLGTLRSVGPGKFEYWHSWPAVRQLWRTDGQLISTRTFPQGHPILKVGRPYFFGPLGDGIYAIIPAYSVVEKTDPPTSIFAEATWNGGPLGTIFRMPSFDWEKLGDRRTEILMTQASLDSTPMDRYLVSDGGTVYFSGIGEDWIHGFSMETGRELIRFRLALETPSAFTEEDTEKFGPGLNWWRDNTWQAALVEGPEQEVWVQRTFSAEGNGLWPTDVFSPDGRYRGRLYLPFEPRTMVVVDERLYAISPGSTGEPRVVRYRIERKGYLLRSTQHHILWYGPDGFEEPAIGRGLPKGPDGVRPVLPE